MNIYLAAALLAPRTDVRVGGRTAADGPRRSRARWLDTEWANRPDQSSAAPPEYREKYAVIDLEDVRDAEVGHQLHRGAGRWLAVGAGTSSSAWLSPGASASSSIGHRENLFHHLPQVEFFASQWAFLRSLAAGDEPRRTT
jgi:hypothetical protein